MKSVKLGIAVILSNLLVAQYSIGADSSVLARTRLQSESATAASNVPTNLFNLEQTNRVPNRFLVFLKTTALNVPLHAESDSKTATETLVRDLAQTVAETYHGTSGQIYTNAGSCGFAIEMTESAAKALAKDPRIDRVYAQLTDFPP
jgi:hypothetical protein